VTTSESPYRSAVSIDALVERVEKLEKAIEKLRTHYHDVTHVHCPKCGTRHQVVTQPWAGIVCGTSDTGQPCGGDLGAALAAKEKTGE
jgi:hypothetical protein